MLLFTYGYNESHLKLSVDFLTRFDASFHYPENVDRYKVAFRNHQIL